MSRLLIALLSDTSDRKRKHMTGIIKLNQKASDLLQENSDCFILCPIKKIQSEKLKAKAVAMSKW